MSTKAVHSCNKLLPCGCNCTESLHKPCTQLVSLVRKPCNHPYEERWCNSEDLSDSVATVTTWLIKRSLAANTQ